MDGINPNLGVVTIGATNNPQLLDYALRSRFEEEIEFVLPDKNERRQILEMYVNSMPPYQLTEILENCNTSFRGMSGKGH